jgi:hypothetical protein
MSERDADVFPGGDSPAVPDASGSTAQFRAFANQVGEAPWSMRASGRKVALLAALVIVVAIILAVIALAVAG